MSHSGRKADSAQILSAGISSSMAPTSREDDSANERKSVAHAEVISELDIDEAVLEEFERNENYFKQGELDKCIEHYKAQLTLGENLSLIFAQIASLCFSALNEAPYSGRSSTILKTEYIEKLIYFLKAIELSAYVDGKEDEIEQNLALFSKTGQLENLLLVSQFLENKTVMNNKNEAEQFIQAVESLNETIFDFLPQTPGFIQHLNKIVAQALELIYVPNSEELREKIISLDRLAVGDYLRLHEHEGKVLYIDNGINLGTPIELTSKKFTPECDQTSLDNETKEQNSALEPKSGHKSRKAEQSLIYFFDVLDEQTIQAMRPKLKEAAKNGAQYLYVELPIQLAHFFKRANRTGNLEVLKKIFFQLENIRMPYTKDVAVAAQKTWLNNILKVIALAYENKIRVLPVLSNAYFLMPSHSTMTDFSNLETQVFSAANNIKLFNRIMNLARGNDYIGFFSLAFSDLCQDLSAAAHVFMHPEFIDGPRLNILKASSINGVRFLLSHGFFKLTHPLKEITILEQQTQENQEESAKKIFVHGFHEADLYLTPLLLKVRLLNGRLAEPLTIAEAMNICLIADNLAEAEAKKLVEAHQVAGRGLEDKQQTTDLEGNDNKLRNLFIMASRIAMNSPGYSTNNFPNPYLTPLASLLKVREPFLEEKFQLAVSTAREGVLFFHLHDDLESFEILIEQLPMMACNEKRPLKHLYLELPTEFNILLGQANETGDTKAVRLLFDMLKDRFTSSRSVELYLRLIDQAVKNKVRIFAIDRTNTYRVATLLSSNTSSAKSAAIAYSDSAMAEEIIKHNASLRSGESFIGLFGLSHRGIGDHISNCSNCAFLPRNYLKNEVEVRNVYPEYIGTQISEQASPLAPLLKQILPRCAEIFVTRPCDILKQKEEIQSAVNKLNC